MIRRILAVSTLGSAFVLGSMALTHGLAAEPLPPKPVAGSAIELILIGDEKLARVDVHAEVSGTPISAVWDETFAKMFAYFDRSGDGALDANEAGHLPSARALRQAMSNGFTPPIGTAPTLAELDRSGDGKVAADELAACYRKLGVGDVPIGVGRLPASEALSAALLKSLDSDADGMVSEKEWLAASDTLKKLDKNDDELISANELVPKVVYPGASGTVLLSPPTADRAPGILAKLPVVRLPADGQDAHWANEIARRNARFKASELASTRGKAPDATWAVKLGDEAADAFTFVVGGVRVDRWNARGRVSEALATARERIQAAKDAPPEQTEEERRDRGGVGRKWLVPIADRDGDGKLDAKELGAWFDLQTQIARGQVLITILDGAGLFELIDASHDGALSVRELRTSWSRLKEAQCVTEARFDPRTLPHMQLMTASMGYPQSLAIELAAGPAWFRSMDRNGDGDVSRREFTGPAEVFEKMDLDKDGLLNAEEANTSSTKS